MDKENIIDFGKWYCPTSWDELNLKTFIEIEKYYSENDKNFDARDVLHIFTNRSVDEINALPMEFTEKLFERLSWLQETPQWGKPSNKVVIDGVTYQVNVREKLKTGEYIAVDSILKSDKHNYAAILAILCRKEGEPYDLKFENEIVGGRIEMWERVPVYKVMPILSFFLSLWMVLHKNTQLYSLVEEAISHTRNHIESSHKSGDISKRSMKSAMTKLKKLEKSINSI